MRLENMLPVKHSVLWRC